MRRLAVALNLLYTCHGRRIAFTTQRVNEIEADVQHGPTSPIQSHGVDAHPAETEHPDRGAEPGPSPQDLATLLLAASPSAGYHPASLAVRPSVRSDLATSSQALASEPKLSPPRTSLSSVDSQSLGNSVPLVRKSTPTMDAAPATSTTSPFSVDTAVLLAGFAFEAYNEPAENDSRWENGADGCNVAFMSDAFARHVYEGMLEVRLKEVKELPNKQNAAQSLLSGSNIDPYVVFALNEETEEGPKEGAVALERAVDRARSSTVWSESLIERMQGKGEDGRAEWDNDEVFYLYVQDPSKAQLAFTVFDEEVGIIEDIALGAGSVKLRDIMTTEDESKRKWEGWVPLTYRPAETQDNAVQLGAVAGAVVAGPMGAAAGGFIGSLIKKPVQGQVRIQVKYTPLTGESQGRPDAAAQVAELDAKISKLQRVVAAMEDLDEDTSSYKAQIQSAKEAKAKLIEAEVSKEREQNDEDGEEGPTWQPVLANKAAPKGGTDGIDWSELSRRVGTPGKSEGDAFELCCFVSHEPSSTEAAIWRDRETRRVVLAFRGTSDVVDVVTDVNFVQTPLEQRADGKESDDPRMVHSGFFAGARAVSRRIKELLVSACEGTPGEWRLLVTGHSLGGALATLVAPDLAAGVDKSRGFKARKDTSWFGKLTDVASRIRDGPGALIPVEPPTLNDICIYTFGAPRVGNSEFAAYFEEAFEGREAFRVVNGADIVARLPRDGNSAGVVLDYEHCGRTVLVDEEQEASASFNGFWIEGESADGECPLKDVTPLTNPFSEQTLLGSTGKTVSTAATKIWDGIDSAAKVKSRKELESAVGNAAEELSKAKNAIQSRVAKLQNNPLEMVSMLGLNQQFVESELKMIESLTTGTAISHHLEPSYFEGLKNGLDATRPIQIEEKP